MNAREIIKILKKDDWILKGIKGSHHQYIHHTKKGKVSIPFHSKKDLKKKTLESIYKQAGFK